MRLTINFCQKKECNNIIRSGFRFCHKPNCGKKNEVLEEE